MGNEHNKIPEQSKIKQKEAAPLNDALNIKKYLKIGKKDFGLEEMTNYAIHREISNILLCFIYDIIYDNLFKF